MQNDVHHACIIIDDPLLREKYGFLNYYRLLNLMDNHNFFTTIAFVPFNFNRTDKKIAALFKERADRFSLCVHGCDHVKGEFGITDLHYLDNLVKLATARMVEHERITGIPFDRIMVFPQGIFSNEALEALKLNNYSAAINTVPIPIGGSISSDLPLFRRYTPEHFNDGASTNPIFIVLHHDYFKNGYTRLSSFVDKLNESYKIQWASAGSIISNYIHSTPQSNVIRTDVDLSGLALHGYRGNTKILMRRYLSEFRDNYLCKNDSLFAWAKKFKDLMKW